MRIKIVQWNIFYKEKFSNIASVLKKINPDIVCLQEVRVNSRFNPGIEGPTFIAKKLKLNYFFQGAHFFLNDETQGNAILSRFPIEKSHFKHTQKFNPKKITGSKHEGRSYTQVILKTEQGRLTVGTSHVSFADGFKVDPKRKKEMDNLIKELRKHQQRYIFGGDLNAVPQSYLVKEIRKSLRNVGPKFSEISADKNVYNESAKVGRKSVRIDYLFATKDIKVKSAKILKTKYSDHYPIVATIEVN